MKRKIRRILFWLKLKKRSVKFFFQRLFRGYSDDVTWNLDCAFASWLVPRLKLFKKLRDPCCPYSIEKDDWLTEEEWNAILDKMIEGFELLSADAFDTESNDKIDTALDLFYEYARALWW